MKKIHFISYGNNAYENAKNRINKEAHDMNVFSSITIYSPSDFSSNFKKKYNDILQYSKGNGYWLWKEYFILKKLNEIEFNDYLIYCDAGCTLNKNGICRLNEYIELIDKSENGILSFQLPHVEHQYTTSQIFNALNINMSSNIVTSGQLVGGIIIMKKCDNVMNIFNKFFEIIDIDHNLITDNYNKKDQHASFIDNRHDQSILSVIRKMCNTCVIPDETWYPDFNCEQAKKIPFLATRKK